MNPIKLFTSYWEILLRTAFVEFKSTYAGSIAGIAWGILGPALLVGCYSLVYAVIFKVRPVSLTPSAYVLYVLAGLVSFISFAQSLGASAASIVAKRALLVNTVFPAELIPVRRMMVTNVFLIVGSLLVASISVVFIGWSPILLTLPLFVIAQLIFTFGIAWILSMVSVLVRDVQYAIQYTILMFFIITPIAYIPDMVPDRLKLIMYANPIYYFVHSMQMIVVYHEFPPVEFLAMVAVLSIGLFFAGFVFFSRSKSVLFDYA